MAPESSASLVANSGFRQPAAHARRGAQTWLPERLPERLADILTAETGVGGAAMSQLPRERRGELLDVEGRLGGFNFQ